MYVRKFGNFLSTNTFQNCHIYEGRRLIRRHLSAPSSVFEILPLSTQKVCLNIVNCFTDATRGLKAKKAPTNSLFVETTANERAVTCKVYRRSSVFNEEWLKAWSFYRGTFFLSSRFREERKKKKGGKRRRKKLTRTNRFFEDGETCPHISRKWWLFIEIIHVLLLWKSYQGIESLRQHSSCFLLSKERVILYF